LLAVAEATVVAAEGGERVAHAVGTYAIPPARSVDSGGATA
jgi:acyl-coenzyme A thioesterase PaaI-like protein